VTEEFRTALHESSHAIVCASQFFQQGNGERIEGGLFLTGVTIIPQHGHQGECGVFEKTDDVRTLNAIDLAGVTATYLATNSMSEILYDLKGDADFIAVRMGISAGNIMSAMGSILTGERSQFEQAEWFRVLVQSYKLCRMIVETRWLYILALADHLLTVKDMNLMDTHKYLGERRIFAREWGEGD
jgi:hypothetical protein